MKAPEALPGAVMVFKSRRKSKAKAILPQSLREYIGNLQVSKKKAWYKTTKILRPLQPSKSSLQNQKPLEKARGRKKPFSNLRKSFTDVLLGDLDMDENEESALNEEICSESLFPSNLQETPRPPQPTCSLLSAQFETMAIETLASETLASEGQAPPLEHGLKNRLRNGLFEDYSAGKRSFLNGGSTP